jgi:hypothetical protein
MVSQLLGSAQRSEESAQFMYERVGHFKGGEVRATRCHEPPLGIVTPFGAVARRRTIAPETAGRQYAALLQATCFGHRSLPPGE